MKLLKLVYVITCLLAISSMCACSNEYLDGQLDEPEENGALEEISIDAATEKALSIFPGSVDEVDREEEQGLDALKVEIEGAQGEEVSIFLEARNGDLLRIDGEEGPFGYDLDPGKELLGFAAAKAIAEKQFSYPQLEEWSLYQDEEFDLAWVYTFEFESEEVVLDGETGEVLEIDN
ncbi:MAG: PepSY domain-containing protein [Bacteroidota bacterium]